MASYKKAVEKTEKAHQDEIFKVKGREPTNYGADTNIDSPGEESSHFASKTTDNGYLNTSHDHVTGKITHQWSYPKNPKFKAESEELDEAGLVSKATLKRYRNKAKASFKEKGGINAALEKQDKEKKVEVRKEEIEENSVEHYDALERDRKAKWHYKRAGKTQGASLSKGIKHDFESQLLKRDVKDSNGNQTPLRKEEEQIDELDRKTLKSYQRKATTSRQRAWDKGDKEEDKSMSTDGNKYPEKQARHQANANVQHKKWNKREKGLDMVGKKLSKEGMEIVDTVMVNDTIDSASAYIEAMEVRMNDIVAEFKNELKVSLFDFSDVSEARKPKPGSPGGSWVDRDVADKFKKEAKEKKQFASGKREIDRLKKQGK